MCVTTKGANRDATEALPPGLLVVFHIEKEKLGLLEVIQLCLDKSWEEYQGGEDAGSLEKCHQPLMRSNIIGWEPSRVIGIVNELNDKIERLHKQVTLQTLHVKDFKSYSIYHEALNIT